MRNIRFGDIIEIKTRIGLAYALYTHQHSSPPKYGSLIHVFAATFEERPVNFDWIAAADVQFTTFFALQSGINKGWVEVVSNVAIPVSLANFPIFRNGTPNLETKKVDIWWLWDGNKQWRVSKLTSEQRSYPLLAVWTYALLLERIESRWKVECDPVWGEPINRTHASDNALIFHKTWQHS